MVGYILKRSLAVLAKKPVMLWGVSLLGFFIGVLIMATGFYVPIITIPIILTLSAGMFALYLDGYNGKPISSKQLFKGFSKENLFRVTGGMCWYYLWSIIWSFVPVVGIIKSYSYRFTPYILITRPDISAMDALKISMMETKGYKLMMFLTDLIIVAAVTVALVVLSMLSLIPHAGIAFAIIAILLYIALWLFLPLFSGIVNAAFYQEVKSGTFTAASYKPASYNQKPETTFVAPVKTQEDTAIKPKEGDWYCGECNTLNAAGTIYCRACGAKIVIKEEVIEEEMVEPEEPVIEEENGEEA